ncbi:glutathione S-transferase family protein [Archangium gephyra]|uniref:glutathione S-transferase family protein n=1 Tax=Archangium gephyra TaxID=48 RepID=UPI0035D4654F
MLRIYNFARGARGLRVVWLCEEMGLPYHLERLPFPTPAAYRALNPLGTVPFLEDEGGVALNESVAMLLYVAQRYGPTSLLPAQDDPRLARVLQMTVFSEATIGAGLNPLMAAHFAAPEADKRNWSVRGIEDRVKQALAYVVGMLGSHPHVAGADFTLADIAMSTSLSMWRGALGQALPDPLAAYQERLAARPAYQRAQAMNSR